jgi:hypothetical protein
MRKVHTKKLKLDSGENLGTGEAPLFKAWQGQGNVVWALPLQRLLNFLKLRYLLALCNLGREAVLPGVVSLCPTRTDPQSAPQYP